MADGEDNNVKEKLIPPVSAPNKTKEIVDKYFPHEEKGSLKTDNSFETRFKMFISVVIILNGLTLGAMSQWPECIILNMINVYLILDTIFALCYTTEVFIKWNKTGVKRYFWDGQVKKWNVIDFSLTIISLMEVAGMATSRLLPGSSVQHVLQPLSVLRLARLIRIMHLLEDIPALTITIGGVMGSAEPLVWIVVALIFAAYVFAIFFHLMVKTCDATKDCSDGCNDCSDAYKDLVTAMNTLTAVVTLNAWTDTIPETQEYLLFPFYMWVLVSTFGITNVIIGVMVDATVDTKVKLEWANKRKSLMRMGGMWEEEIHSKGLSREALALLSEEDRKVKQTTRRAVVRHIISDIIEQRIVGFPPGTEPEEVRLVLDKNGDGRVSHEEFTLGLGRILLADPLQQSIMTFINQGMIRRSVKEIHENWDNLTEDMKKNKKKYENLNGVVGEMKQRLEKLQQAVKEIKAPKKK